MGVVASSLRLPGDLHEAVTEAAQRAQLSRNAYIERVLRGAVFGEEVRTEDLQEQIDELRSRLARLEALAGEAVT